MRPDISEFSFGYAVTDELINWQGTALYAAPVFPSLRDEAYLGYDVGLDRQNGIPLFIQFKLSDCMVRANAYEHQNGPFSLPYYRMHIRPAMHSAQHEMLLDLEQDTGAEVSYCAPAFHTPEELNSAYLHHNICSQSLWIAPSWIGRLPDNYAHYVAFQLQGPRIFCSKPKEMDHSPSFEFFSERVLSKYKQESTKALKEDNLRLMAESLKHTARKHTEISVEEKTRTERMLIERTPIQQIAYYSSVYLDCQFFTVHEG